MLDFIKKTILAGVGDPGTKISFGESLLVMLICMLIIFAVLAVLMGVIYLVRYGNKLLSKDPVKQEKKIEVLPVKNEEDDDDAIVAAITAAVSICLEAEKEPGGISAPFVIKNIKRVK